MTDDSPAPKRDATGKFLRGVSGNPGGRPAAVREVAEAARWHTKTAIDVLAQIAADPKAPAHARVSAAACLLDRGWGRAPQSIEVSQHGSRDMHQMSDAELIAYALARGTAQEVMDVISAAFAIEGPVGDGGHGHASE